MSKLPLEPEILWVSDHGLLVVLGKEPSLESHSRVRRAFEALRAARLPGVQNLHPAYASLLVSVDPLAADPEHLEGRVHEILAGTAEWDDPPLRHVSIPVCYDPPYAPDLLDVARHHDLDPEEVVRLHAGAEYVVAFLGFVPGFPYLLGLTPRLATPRLPTPRASVPAGSVAIGGSQTGIYPFSTPGGWRLIGRTPLTLFDPSGGRMPLLTMGDRVRFEPLSAPLFRALSER